mgnify:FL=1
MNDKQWFKFYQPSLLGLVNTDHGRDLFDISRDLPTIVEIGPWYYRWIIGKGEYQSEFHSKAVYFRKLLHRWDEIVRDLEHPLFVPKTVLYKGREYAVPMGGATTTKYPDADTESTSVDGHIGFAGLDDRIDWSAARDDDGSAVTQVRDSHGTINSTCFQRSGTWEDFTRGVFLFDTSSIADDQVVSAAVFSFTSNQTTTSASELTWNVVSSAPASNTALVAGDYDSFGTASMGTIEADSGVTTDSSTYNDITLNSTGRAAVTVTGVSKFGFRWEADRADAEPSSATAGCQISILSADTSSTSKDPKLVVTHAAPVTNIDNVSGVAFSSIANVAGVTATDGQAINGVTF